MKRDEEEQTVSRRRGGFLTFVHVCVYVNLIEPASQLKININVCVYISRVQMQKPLSAI